jgi:hypothetical protein
MINRNVVGQPTTLFWNCVGLAIVVMAFGMSWSITQTKAFELELAQYKLKTGTALTKVQKVSDTLETTTNQLPITAQKKEQIIDQLDQTNEVIEQATSEVENLDELIEH